MGYWIVGGADTGQPDRYDMLKDNCLQRQVAVFQHVPRWSADSHQATVSQEMCENHYWIHDSPLEDLLQDIVEPKVIGRGELEAAGLHPVINSSQ